MTRAHRRWHVWLWLAFGLLAAAGFVLSIARRPEVLP